MKRLATALFLIVALLLVPAGASHADGHGGGHGGWHGGGWHGGHGGWHGGWHGGVFIGGPWWWGPYPYVGPYPYAYPYGYYPPTYYPYPPAVVDGPSVYIEQQAAPEGPSQGYWYYCASAQAYYPTVQKCREGWIKVPPAPR